MDHGASRGRWHLSKVQEVLLIFMIWGHQMSCPSLLLTLSGFLSGELKALCTLSLHLILRVAQCWWRSYDAHFIDEETEAKVIPLGFKYMWFSCRASLSASVKLSSLTASGTTDPGEFQSGLWCCQSQRAAPALAARVSRRVSSSHQSISSGKKARVHISTQASQGSLCVACKGPSLLWLSGWSK